VCVRVCVRERERECVCVQERETERESFLPIANLFGKRESVCVRERESGCVCVCVRERERAFCQLPNRTIKLTKPLTCKADMHFVWRVERDKYNGLWYSTTFAHNVVARHFSCIFV